MMATVDNGKRQNLAATDCGEARKQSCEENDAEVMEISNNEPLSDQYLGSSCCRPVLELTEVLDTVPIKLHVVESTEDDFSTELQMSSAPHNLDINCDSSNTDFVYSDFDTLENELGEIYGYYELSSLSYNFEVFHTYLEIKKIDNWRTSGLSEKRNFLNDLLDDLELVDEYKRSDAVLAINYMVQGCWKDLENAAEQLECIEENVMLLLQCNGFWRVWNILNCVLHKVVEKSNAWEYGLDERIMENCLNVLCTITNVAFRKRGDALVQEFLLELKMEEEDSVLIIVLEYFTNIVDHLNSHSFLLKKLLLLSRDLILLIAGDSDNLKNIKDQCRKEAGLSPCKEDTVTNCRRIDLLQKHVTWYKMKDINLMSDAELAEYTRQVVESEKMSEIRDKNSTNCLPWLPKSSLEVLRACFKEDTMYKVDPRPKIPIWMNQKANRLVKHLHIPLSAFQLQEDELIRKYPKAFVGQGKPAVEQFEQLFSSLLPFLNRIANLFVTVLTEATPTSHPAQVNPKHSKISPPFIPWLREHSFHSHFVEDSIREAEIIVKSISTILILLLKHAKLNHVYQFECIASEIVAASTIPCFLGFLNGNVERHLCQQPVLQHPDCPFKAINLELRNLQDTSVNDGDSSSVEVFGLSWRKTTSYINLLRILNKVVKGKPSRILMLCMFKAHHCLRRCLNIRNSLFQQYTLKLLKLQCKFLDQEWKRDNQYIISAIYHKVRHRLLEDWIGEMSSSSKMRKRPETITKPKKWPWDHIREELFLNAKVTSFLKRRYALTMPDSEEGKESSSEEESRKCFAVELPESFKQTYAQWLDVEVFNKTIQWEKLTSDPCLI